MVKSVSCIFLLLLLTACQRQTADILDPGAGRGAAEPRLSSSPNGVVLLSYLEPSDSGSVLRVTELGETGWGEPRRVVDATNLLVNWADFPSVLATQDERWVAHWMTMTSGPGFAYNANFAMSHDRGRTWSKTNLLHNDRSSVEHGFVSLLSTTKGVLGVWLDGQMLATTADAETFPKGTQLRSVEIDRLGNLLNEEVVDDYVCDCCQTASALTSQGAVVAYRNRSLEEVRDIYLARQIDGKWKPGVPIANDGWQISGCPVNGPAIDAAGDQLAVAWYTAVPQPRIQLALSNDAGASFYKVIDIGASNPVGRVDLALLANNDVAISWLERGEGWLLAKVVSSQGVLGDEVKIAPMETHRDAGFPQMTAWNNTLVFAWTDTSSAESEIRSVRLSLPLEQER